MKRTQTKGKVESGIGYIRKNFLCGRETTGVSDLRGQLRTWLWQTANQRVHGTTHQRIFTAWQKEKAYLLPLAGRASLKQIDLPVVEVRSLAAYDLYDTVEALNG